MTPQQSDKCDPYVFPVCLAAFSASAAEGVTEGPPAANGMDAPLFLTVSKRAKVKLRRAAHL
jgi:hypothetical protein